MGARSWPSKNVPNSYQTPLLEESIDESYSSSDQCGFTAGNQTQPSKGEEKTYRPETGVIPGRYYNHPPIGGGWPEGGGKAEKKSNYPKTMLCLQPPTCHPLSQSHALRVSDPLENATYHSRLLQERAIIMKSVQNDNLPHQVLMPDGEETPLGSFTHAQIRCSNQENELINPCVRPPPNRTVFRDASSSPPSRSHSCGALEEEKGSTAATASFFTLLSNWMNSKLKEKEPPPRISKDEKGNLSRNRCSSMSSGTSGKKSSPASPTKSHLIPTPMCVIEHSSAPAMFVHVPCKPRAGVKRSPVLRTDSRTFPNSASNTANPCACATGSLCVHSSPAPIGRQACDNITNSKLVVQSSANVKLASLPVVLCFAEAVPESPQNQPSYPVLK